MAAISGSPRLESTGSDSEGLVLEERFDIFGAISEFESFGIVFTIFGDKTRFTETKSEKDEVIFQK